MRRGEHDAVPTDHATRPRPSSIADLGTLLGVWAHPDDETYLSAGLMAAAVDRGQRVVCVNATRGEHGTPDPERWPPDRLARTRDHEIAAAMAVLGVDDHRCFGLEDGTLAELDPARGARRIVTLIDEVRPDTIVTFGPDGMTGHADHRTICAWATAAWRAVGPTPRLLYATTTAAFVDEHAELHAELGVFEPGFPRPAAPDEVVLTLSLDDALLDRKLAALRCQATQTAPVLDAMGVDAFRTWWRTETFRAPDSSAAGAVRRGHT